jgi:hypothetical protein
MIKINMEMPKSCAGCILCKVLNGGESARCRMLNVSLTPRDFFKFRPVACPLQEVKE